MPKYKKFNNAIFYVFILFIYLPRKLYCLETDKKEWESSDPTKGLNDADIDMALNGLSLSDLNALSELIDTANKFEYNYNEGSLLKDDNMKDLNLYDANINNHDYLNEDNSLRMEPQYAIDANALNHLEENENQRAKRDDHHEVQIDEEYIKQLDFSFPRDIAINQHEENDLKKDHIRVKRD